MSQSFSYGQSLADQTPRFENQMRKKKPRRENQVIGKGNIIRPDKRTTKHKYL